jgi:hypothetical protein
VIRCGYRPGDQAPMAVIEYVDRWVVLWFFAVHVLRKPADPLCFVRMACVRGGREGEIRPARSVEGTLKDGLVSKHTQSVIDAPASSPEGLV